jgi:hypothetical protein
LEKLCHIHIKISKFSSGTPIYYLVAQLLFLEVAHHAASSGAPHGSQLLNQISVAHHMVRHYLLLLVA